jgi:hypothetical protein
MQQFLQFVILTFICSSTCFGRPHAHHQELNNCSSSHGFYLRIVVIAVLFLWSARSQIQHCYHHDMKVKPEAATAVIELLMLRGRTPETCWAVNKRQANELKHFCIWLVIYLNYTYIHAYIRTYECVGHTEIVLRKLRYITADKWDISESY